MNANDVEWVWRSDEVEGGVVSVLEQWLSERSARPVVRRALDTLLAENERLRAVLGHCPRGIAVLDAHGNVVGFNRELRELLGATPALGEPIDRLFEPEDRQILEQVTASARQGGRSAGVLRVAAAEGREIEFFAATLPGDEADAIGVVLAGEDRTAALRDDSDRALVDEANTESAFQLAASVLRHELEASLRTAMAAARDARCNGTASLATIEDALAHAEAILVRRTALPPPPDTATETSSVADAARRAARFALVGDARRRALVQIQIEPELTAAMSSRHLVQVFSNLLSNAVRAIIARGRLGTIHLDAEGDSERVVVRVHDDGVGIEPHRLQGVFEPGETTTPGAKGLGLGIARLLIERVGGSIRVVSEPGEGTTVSFDLPRHIARDALRADG